MQLNINHQSNNELAISNNETATSTNQFVCI